MPTPIERATLKLAKLGNRDPEEFAAEAAARMLAKGIDPADPQNASYLVVAAQRLSINAHRQRRGVVNLPEFASPGTSDDPAANVIADDEATRLRQHVAKLPEAERDVIRLTYFDGLTNEQVAERLKLPKGTVKTRLRSAKQRLRRALAA